MHQKIWSPLSLSLLLVACGGDDKPSTSGGAMAGEPAGVMAGEPAGVMAGEPAGVMAGEPAGVMAGEPAGVMAGEPAGVMAGEPAGVMAGEPAGVMAGEPAGMMAGEPAGMMAGEPAGVMAGEPAGVMAGEPAGVMAGEPAGMMAGEPAGVMAGTEVMEVEPLPGHESIEMGLEFMGSVEDAGRTDHLFFVSETSTVLLFTSDGAGGCPQGEDTMLALYELDAMGARTQLSDNDDGGAGLCSRIEIELERGNYVAEVRGFGDRAVGSYVLNIVILNLLEEGESCSIDDLSAGLCSDGLACVDSLCVDASPSLTSANAYGYGDRLIVDAQGVDPNGDAAYLDIYLYDEDLNELDFAFGDLDQVDETSCVGRFSGGGFDLSLVTQVGLIPLDSEFNEGEELIVPLGELPVLNAGESCEPQLYTGRCADGYICVEGDVGELSCTLGEPPSANSPVAFSDGERLILKLMGTDPNDDISEMRLSFYNELGAIEPIGGQDSVDLSFYDVRFDMLSAESEHIAIFEGFDLYPQAVAVELRLIDSSGLSSSPLITVISPLPANAVGEACDLERLNNSCGLGFCVVNVGGEGGVCVESLPGLRESCVEEIGCAEGLVCYGSAQGVSIESLYGTCFRTCDENGVELGGEVGCESDEVCVPDFPWREFGITSFESPGFCLPDDQCDPSDTLASCGEGEFFCHRYAETTQCVALDGFTPEQLMAEGEECNSSDIVCAAGLVCEFGQCRAPCVDDASCAEGSRCVAAEGEVYSYCLETCDFIAQDCPESGICQILTSVAGEVISQCVPGSTQGAVQLGESCEPFSGDTPGYWGDCAGAALCDDITGSGVNTCISLCTQEDSPCSGESACIDRLLNTDGAGLCFGDCNPFTYEGCEAAESCQLVGQGLNDTGEERIVGFCAENPNPGAVTTGGACQYDELSSTSDCAPGHLCADLYGAGDICVQLCSIDATGQPDVTCSGAQTCLTEQLGAPVFEELPNLGICIN